MLRIDILSGLPDLLTSALAHGIVRRAHQSKQAQVVLHNLHDYSTNKHRKIDDYPYGGGGGMVLSVAPIHACLLHLQAARQYDEIILLSPGGALLDQRMANNLSLKNNIILICGHYAGVDARVQHWISQEISIGDYVLSGGEAAAWVVCDSVLRLIPGVLHDGCSALDDTFQHHKLAPPAYTRPQNYQGLPVPDVLLSGDAKRIAQWREKQATLRTKNQRPNLLPPQEES